MNMNAPANISSALTRWRKRPSDQGFATLEGLLEHTSYQRSIAREEVASVGTIEARPVDDMPGALALMGLYDDRPAAATHYSFGQLSGLAKAPAGYLRTLPSDMAADCINYGLRRQRNADVGTLVRANGSHLTELSAATGPGYGRIWNRDIVAEIIDKVGSFRAPQAGLHYGDQEKMTFFASDRDMFIFLVDEDHPIELHNGRGGTTETLYRGIMMWNSEVGATSLGVATFLFRSLCFNRSIFGAKEYGEIRIRHSSGAPGRYLDEVVPAIEAIASSSTIGIEQAIEQARRSRLGNEDDVTEWLTKRYTKERSQALSMVHFAEEGRPIENLWDVNVAVTAYARQLEHQDARVDLERDAGKVLALAS
jgi:hypothetical protein